MAKQEEKYGRAFTLTERQGTKTHLSTPSEKAGPNELIKVADFTCDFSMKGKEVGRLDAGLAVSWDNKGAPLFENLKAPIALGTLFRGVATIGSSRGEGIEFENARLTEFRCTPRIGHELHVRARFRVYVQHETDKLHDLQIAGVCKVAFKGKLVVKTVDDEDAGDDENEDQGSLDV